jgi:hypothetical protein
MGADYSTAAPKAAVKSQILARGGTLNLKVPKGTVNDFFCGDMAASGNCGKFILLPRLPGMGTASEPNSAQRPAFCFSGRVELSHGRDLFLLSFPSLFSQPGKQRDYHVCGGCEHDVSMASVAQIPSRVRAARPLIRVKALALAVDILRFIVFDMGQLAKHGSAQAVARGFISGRVKCGARAIACRGRSPHP